MNSTSQDNRTSRRRRRRFRVRRIAFASGFLVVCVVGVSLLAYSIFSGDPGGTSPTAVPDTSEELALTTSENTSRKESSSREESTRRARQPAEMPPDSESCDSLQVLMDQAHPLPATYAPQDLASLAAAGIPTVGGDMYLRSGAVPNLSRLTSRATEDGEEVVVTSAYRSYTEQQQTFAHYTAIYGNDVEMVSAPPGQSQHQLGTTVDFSNAEMGYQLIPTFGNTSASRWLEKNAWKFGYINTYPKQDIEGTGRQWEPWEYRYVGKEAAREIHDSGQSLREFLTEGGITPKC